MARARAHHPPANRCRRVSSRGIRTRSRLGDARAQPPATPAGIGAVLSSGLGLRTAIDLAGLAIAGGLFIVPSFAAVQAWAGADRRARVVAAVNVLNAAFMVAGGLAVAMLQKAGLGTATLFLVIGGACLAAALAIGRTMPASAFRDFLSILFRPSTGLRSGARRISRRRDRTPSSRSTM